MPGGNQLYLVKGSLSISLLNSSFTMIISSKADTALNINKCHPRKSILSVDFYYAIWFQPGTENKILFLWRFTVQYISSVGANSSYLSKTMSYRYTFENEYLKIIRLFHRKKCMQNHAITKKTSYTIDYSVFKACINII